MFKKLSIEPTRHAEFARQENAALLLECMRLNGGVFNPAFNANPMQAYSQLLAQNPAAQAEVEALCEAVLGKPLNAARQAVADARYANFADVQLTPSAILQAGTADYHTAYAQEQSFISDVVFPTSMVQGTPFYFRTIHGRTALSAVDDAISENAMPNQINIGGDLQTVTCTPFGLVAQFSNTTEFQGLRLFGNQAQEIAALLKAITYARMTAHEERCIAMLVNTNNYANGNAVNQTSAKWNTANGKPYTEFQTFIDAALLKPNYLIVNPYVLNILQTNAEMIAQLNGANNAQRVTVEQIQQAFGVKVLIAGGKKTTASVGESATPANSPYMFPNIAIMAYAAPTNLLAATIEPVIGCTAIVRGSQITTVNSYAYGTIAPYAGAGVFGGGLLVSADMKAILMPNKSDARQWYNVV